MLDQFFTASFWQFNLAGNSLKTYFFALTVFAGCLLVFKFFQRWLLTKIKHLAEKTKTDIDDTFVQIIQSVKPPFYVFLSFWVAVRFICLNDFVRDFVNAVLIIWVTGLVINAVQVLINYVATKKIKTDDESGRSIVNLLSLLAKIILWSFGILLILSNIGINVSSLIAGLGIGGVAVALALQNILGDLFSSFAIFFDKPFVPGDFIIVGDDMGTVEKIGIKTTRLRALTGQQIIISNKELTTARVHNYKRMQERRIVFSIGVTYETPTEKLKQIPEIIKNILASISSVRLDRVHFKSFADFALIFEIVYYVNTPDYAVYMDAQQEINLKIKDEFEARGIEMAYPTQTIYLAKQ